MSARIATILGRTIFDSRGRPTVEADVVLDDGTLGRASAPSGASTGRHEAHELRDGDAAFHEGRGVTRAVAHVGDAIAKVLEGLDPGDQQRADDAMRAADGTENLSRLGANAILAVSLAVARAGAAARRVPLHVHLASLREGLAPSLPLPMVNILSGGAHAARGMDFQDFLVIPVGARSLDEAIAMIARVRSAAGDEMAARGLSTMLADEGGLSPGYGSAREALDLLLATFERAGLRAGTDVAIALDVAATELLKGDRYRLAGEGRDLDGGAMADYVAELCRDYPIVSVEDPLAEDDWAHWRAFTDATRVQVVGDDLFVTSRERIARGAAERAANGVLIKLNQNGTLSGTLDAMEAARAAGFATIVSARSGETEDAFMSDFAVATGAGQIKIGSFRNSERLAKYNQLLRLSEDSALPFAGAAALSRR